jgi:DNA polymerase-1
VRVVIDIEANGLHSPTEIWVIVCKDIDTGEINVFRRPTQDTAERTRFLKYADTVSLWVGHNWLEYDYPVLNSLLGLSIPSVHSVSVDTLILSRLVDYSRPQGHSIEAYGEEFGLEKIDVGKSIAGHNPFFDKYSEEMESYCERDVEICHHIFNRYSRIVNDNAWKNAIHLEQHFQLLVNSLNGNGFAFNVDRANKLLRQVTEELQGLDKEILDAFPPKVIVVREFTPKTTKYGTLSKTSIPRSLWDQAHTYEAGKTYQQTKLREFNPASHKQLIEVLWEAGWKPVDKTKTHIEFLRTKDTDKERKVHLERFGWQINEANLSTLPDGAPNGARLLAKRILLESRRRTLTEWLSLVRDDGRIHGKFLGIGAWTHRMAHQNPNTANIPREFQEDGSVKLLGKEMRSLWCAPRNRLLVGVDAEGIQLRVFAHYINDPEFTDALVRGQKADQSDPHSLNKRILGSVCKTRQAAKRFIFALLLGGGLAKLASILGCSTGETTEALNRLLQRYSGFAEMREKVFPRDARRGWFIGLDGRRISIPDQSFSGRKHLAMSGYLQAGEAVIMKKAALLWHSQLMEEKDLGRWLFVNMVHDEWQTEVKNDFKIAKRIAEIQADSLRIVGEELKLRCPLAGSYFNDDIKDYTIGTNWYQTH